MQPKFQKPTSGPNGSVGCTGCDLERRGSGYAPVDGPADARLIFIAEALGPEEVIVGRPLMGAAGGVHSRILHRAGISRELTRADNCCRCMPPGMWFDEKASWFYPALSHCRGYLQSTLDRVPDNGVVVTLGGVALRSILNLHGADGIALNNFHHTVNRDPSDRYWVIPTFHPAFLQRGAMHLLEVVTNAYRRAFAISQRGFVRTPHTLVVDPHPEWVAQWVSEHLRRVSADPAGVHLSLDTEFMESLANAADESEIVVGGSSPLLRINVGNDATTGITYPYAGEYIKHTETLLAGIARLQGIVWLWNKYADWDKLHQAGHTLDGITAIDGMWAWHFLQSDLPRGLGFAAALASDFGPWKHWAKDKAKEGPYAAADAVQNYRTCLWVMKALIQSGQWDYFLEDWHDRDQCVLRPSYLMGVPVDRPALEVFHQELQVKHAAILEKIKTVGAQGTLRPKQGYAKKPTLGVCGHCNGTGKNIGMGRRYEPGETVVIDGRSLAACDICGGTGAFPAVPPKSILGQQKGKRKSEAKQDYLAEGVQLVERPVTVSIRVCRLCAAEGVGPRHQCRARQQSRNPANSGDRIDPVDLASPIGITTDRVVTRWFWQLPFNPSSWQQILSYIETKGHEPGTHRKTKQPTTDKESLKKLAAQTGDPLYQLLLDGRAVEKVDSTYAVGSLQRLDADDRLHPEITPKPSTWRDSSQNPNLQNVVADKDSSKNLAAGFRRCITARDGIPAVILSEEYQQWQQRWGVK
jgi:uracil-DNA glycosylase family 4